MTYDNPQFYRDSIIVVIVSQNVAILKTFFPDSGNSCFALSEMAGVADIMEPINDALLFLTHEIVLVGEYYEKRFQEYFPKNCWQEVEQYPRIGDFFRFAFFRLRRIGQWK